MATTWMPRAVWPQLQPPGQPPGFCGRRCQAHVGPLGASDKHKLDEYLQSVRDIEKRIQKAEQQRRQAALPADARPAGIPDPIPRLCPT